MEEATGTCISNHLNMLLDKGDSQEGQRQSVCKRPTLQESTKDSFSFCGNQATLRPGFSSMKWDWESCSFQQEPLKWTCGGSEALKKEEDINQELAPFSLGEAEKGL